MDTSSTLRSPQTDSPPDSPQPDSLQPSAFQSNFTTPPPSFTSRYSLLYLSGLRRLNGLLHPVRRWLDGLDVRNVKTARWIAKLIPAQCPFERDVKLLGRTLGHIPPLCKLNPFYEQLVTLRFRALCYLADECGEDIRSYC